MSNTQQQEESSSLIDANLTFPTLCTQIGIDSRLRKAISRLNYIHPTLVQSKSIPLAITSGRDLLVRAKTGSGKTLAYCIPVVQKILAWKLLVAERGDDYYNDNEDDSDGEEKKYNEGGAAVKGVILVPTRELCNQVALVLDDLTYYCADQIKVVVLSSSSSANNKKNKKKGENATATLQQEALLRDRPDIVVATPAGLVTHVRNGQLNLKRSVETLVVDEADLILSFGKFLYVSDAYLVHSSVASCTF